MADLPSSTVRRIIAGPSRRAVRWPMHDGRLVEFGDTDALFTNPRERQTEDFITGRYG